MKNVLIYLLLFSGFAGTALAQTQQTRLIAASSYEWDGTLWEAQDSSYTYYEIEDRDTALYFYYWNPLNLQWESDGKRVYTYDTLGNVVDEIDYWFDGTLFINSYRVVTTYAADGISYETEVLNWNGTNWLPVQNYGHTYNAAGQELYYTIKEYINGAWQNEYRYAYNYNAAGLLEMDQYQAWNNTQQTWRNIWRRVYTYNADGKLLLIQQQSLNNQTWTSTGQAVHTYDANGNLQSLNILSNANGAWDTTSRNIFTYDAQNNETINLEQTKNNGVWRNFERQIKTYNAAGLNDTVMIQYWPNNGWVNITLNSTLYNSFGDKVFSDEHRWVNNAWEGEDRLYQYYEVYEVESEEPEDTTGIANIPNTLVATAYPNPFTDELHFKLPEAQSGTVTISLFDLSGKLVAQDRQVVMPGTQLISIATGNLHSGAYVYVLTLSGKQSRGLLAK